MGLPNTSFVLSKDTRWCPTLLTIRYPAQAMAIFAAWSAALYAVANLRSADRPARLASARSRAIRARILSNSFLEVLCFWASLFASKLVQVTLASFHKLLAPLQDGCQEMIMRLHVL